MSTPGCIELRWFAHLKPARWRVRVGDEWRDVVEPWIAESRHRGLARAHLEALARATFAQRAGLYWWQARSLWVAVLYEDEPT